MSCRARIWLLTVFSPALAFAGGSGGAHSYVADAFFSYGEGGYVSFEKQAHGEALSRHCRANRQLWAYPGGRVLRCQEYVVYGGGEGVIKMAGATPIQREAGTTFLFALRPAVAWKIRRATTAEAGEIEASVARTTEQLAAYRRPGAAARAQAAYLREDAAMVFTVPGKAITDEAGNTTRPHLILVRTRDGLRISGRTEDAPSRFLDLDHDGIPEIIESVTCDGNCWNLWKVSGVARLVARMSDH